MKCKKSIFCVLLSILLLFSIGNVKVSFAKEKIYLGGFPAGFTLQSRGAEIIGVTDVLTENGAISPCKDCGIKVGDVILSIDGQEVNNAFDIERVLKNDNLYKIEYLRDGERHLTMLKPALDISSKYKLGVYIRDKINGIGTVTFIKDNRIASLGHPVLSENNNVLEISNGIIYNCEITGCVKGERGKAGELRGILKRDEQYAQVDKNLNCGVFGRIIKENAVSELKEIEIGNARVGEASIYTTIKGEVPSEYSISIVKVDTLNRDTKNYVIKITDEKLLDITGGIVQGMSGSPIVQDGRLVGAVTHVFINDPTRGFGISIDKMINN